MHPATPPPYAPFLDALAAYAARALPLPHVPGQHITTLHHTWDRVHLSEHGILPHHQSLALLRQFRACLGNSRPNVPIMFLIRARPQSHTLLRWVLYIDTHMCRTSDGADHPINQNPKSYALLDVHATPIAQALLESTG